MAYIAGTASSYSDLVTQVIAGLVANGWTNPTGNIVTVSGVYFDFVVGASYISIQAGTGQSGGVLTNASSSFGYLGGTTQSTFTAPTFPVTFRLYINTAPHEVFLLVNYLTDYYQWMTFGKSSITLPGSGCFFSSCLSTNGGYIISLTCRVSATLRGGAYENLSPFRCDSYNATEYGEQIQHGIGTATDWSTTDINAAKYLAPMELCIPNSYNAEPVLLPIRVYSTAYGSNKVAPVLDMMHLRYFKFGSTAVGDPLVLGSDNWDVWPCYKLDAAYPDGDTDGVGIGSSGALGLAVRKVV